MPRAASRFVALGLLLLLTAVGAIVGVLAGTGGPASGPTTAAVSGYPPVRVSIVATPLNGTAPLTVLFVATATGGNAHFAEFNWSFGDGGLGSGARINYTFADPGNFTVRLNVTDTAGDVGTASTQVVAAGYSSLHSPSTDLSPWLIYSAIGGAGALLGVLLVWSFRTGPREDSPDAVDPEPSTPVWPELAPRPETVLPEPAVPIGPTGSLRGTPPAPEPPDVAPEPEFSLASAAPAPPTVPRDMLRLSHRLVLHLGRQGAPSAHEVARIEQTQLGMSRQFGSSQSAMSNVLQRLAAAGVVTFEVRHVAGHPRRLRVYYLTPYGESLARDLRRKAAARAGLSETPNGTRPYD